MPSDEAREPCGAACAGQYADLDFRQAKLCIGAGNADIGRQCQFKTAAEGEAIDCCKDWFARGVNARQSAECAVIGVDLVAAAQVREKLGDIATCAE